MSSREPPPRSSLRRNSSAYKMTRTATMRKEENMRRYSGTQTTSQRVSPVRLSRVSVASSRYSMRSTAGSRKSITSVASSKVPRRLTRENTSPSTGRNGSPKSAREKRRRKASGSRMSSVAQEQDDAFEENPGPTYNNEEFMASNYTYTALSSEDFVQPEVIPAIDLLEKPQVSAPDLTEEGGWRIAKYIKSFRNSMLKDTENVAKSKKNEQRGPNAGSSSPVKDHGKGQQQSGVSNTTKQKTGGKCANVELPKDAHIVDTRETDDNSIARQEPQSKNITPETMRHSTGSVGVKNYLFKRESETSVGPGCSMKNPKSALKGTKSQASMGQARISCNNVRRVSILASLGSLEDMATSLALLEREKTLEAIRRLEDVAKEKRRQLAETRHRLRESLEEEMKINKKLESILQKIRLVRKAGEDASLIIDKETQVFTTRLSGAKPKKP